TGIGRLAETPEIVGAIKLVLGRDGDLAGKQIVVTAGGTQEPIDPVRVITNRSSGKMGYAIAEAARDRGASVTLVAAPTALPPPVGVRLVRVATAREMRDAVQAAVAGAAALVMAAAVADFEAARPEKSKIKKKDQKLTIDLTPTPDILSEVGGDMVRVGFAAESQNLVPNARAKLKRKRLDLIVANDITDADGGFESDHNRVVMLDLAGREEALPLLPKYDVGNRILDRVVELLASRAG
ncbi:MAG: bifunctional phosphopantothenoylcysteine decarboxylase/phosphopantothenate--cysteine ligase CoaBC, partial [Dehalococcoidia bacterium]